MLLQRYSTHIGIYTHNQVVPAGLCLYKMLFSGARFNKEFLCESPQNPPPPNVYPPRNPFLTPPISSILGLSNILQNTNKYLSHLVQLPKDKVKTLKHI